MSAATKLVLASDSVKVMVSVLLTTPVFVRAIAIVGGVVSAGIVLVAIVTVLLASKPSVLKLPTTSLNLLLATEITLGVVLLAVGVKVAV